MPINFKLNTVSLLLIITSIFLNSCGGGGGGDEQPTSPGQQNTDNSELSGRLYFQDTLQNAYLITASTGLVESIPNTNWENQRDRFPSGVAKFYSHTRQNDPTEFLVISSHCKRENPDPLSDMLSCIVIQNFQGNYLGQFELGDTVANNARISPNGQYIALYRNLNIGSPGYEWLEIYTRDGTLISDRKDESGKFLWFSDGRLLYVYNRHIYFTKKYSTDIDYILTIPEMLGGIDVARASISDFSLSADNTQIAFTLFNDWDNTGRYGDALFIMNADGSNIRKVAISTNDAYKYIDDLTWSPDGRWVMVKEGYTSPQDTTALGTAGYLYVIPTEDMGKVFKLSILDSVRSPEVIQFKHDRNLDKPGVYLTTESLGSIRLEWIP